MRFLIVTAVEAEAEAASGIEDTVVVAGGIGRTNAAAATTQALIEQGPFDAVLSVGVAGALPGADLELGETLVADACVYFEEGLLTPDAFLDMGAMGFKMGDFEGNIVPADEELLDRVLERVPVGHIATVATCSGSDIQAGLVARRTRAIAEAMEGAAVVHAALRMGIPGMEIRTISNTTGDRDRQKWDLEGALESLSKSLPGIVGMLRIDAYS